jgi:hypothetical protein
LKTKDGFALFKAFEARPDETLAADLSEPLGKQGREARERGGFEATFTRNVTIKVC